MYRNARDKMNDRRHGFLTDFFSYIIQNIDNKTKSRMISSDWYYLISIYTSNYVYGEHFAIYFHSDLDILQVLQLI